MNYNHPRTWRAFFISACMFHIAWSCAHGQVFKVGAARCLITPTEPLPLWGYGARHDKLSTGTLHPLCATALVMQCETNKLAIVALDLGRNPSDATLQNIRREIAEKAGIRHMLIAASHTHSGPVMELREQDSAGKFDAALRYYKELQRQIVSVILQANGDLADGRYGYATTQLTGFQRNRHSADTPEAGDHTLAVARFDTSTGKPCAMLINFSAHPTLEDPAGLEFSPDYIGGLRKAVEDAIPGERVLFLQGAAGDQSTDPSHGNNAETYGSQLGREITAVAVKIATKAPAHARLRVSEDRFRFPSRVDLRDSVVRARLNSAFFPELVASYVDEYSEGVQPVLTVATLDNEIGLVGVSGEFFGEHGQRLRERIQLRSLFFVGYCNGYHQYFPTIEALGQGGYGAQPLEAPASPGAGEMMMDTALIRLLQMNGSIGKEDIAAPLAPGASGKGAAKLTANPAARN